MSCILGVHTDQLAYPSSIETSLTGTDDTDSGDDIWQLSYNDLSRAGDGCEVDEAFGDSLLIVDTLEVDCM